MTASSALELRDQLRGGDISARELTLQALQHIDQQQDLGAFIEVLPEEALAAADAADQLIAATPLDERHTLPPLLGLPTAHKDLVQVAGFTTTYGSAAVPHLVAQHDDPIAAAVREAGAICLGKTQVPEFGIAGYSENLIARPARNPFDTTLTAGGSSGGTAAAVATGMIPAAIGSDAGGSIRIPSAACGLVGLKPGRGTLAVDALQGDTDELGAPRMGVSGPMARNVRDAALFYDAVSARTAGGWGGQALPGRQALPGGQALPTVRTLPAGQALPASRALRGVEQIAQLSGLRIGVSFASPFEPHLTMRFDDDALTALSRAVTALEAAGHTVEEAAIDYGNDYPEAFTTVWTQALRRIDLAAGAESRLGALAQWFLESARAASPERIAASVESLQRFARDVAAQWGAYDAVLTPALAFTPPGIGEFWGLGPEGDYRLQCEWAPHTSMVNVVGAPAVTVPISNDTLGLPRGVQLIGRTGSEVQLLQLAAQLLD